MLKTSKSLTMTTNNVKTVETTGYLPRAFDFSSKVNIIVEDWNTIVNLTKIELINKFTENEVKLMLDSTNYLIGTPNLSPIIVLHSKVSDDITLYDADKTHNVNGDVLLDKILNLTCAQAYTLLRLCTQYWDSEEPTEVNIKELFMIKE